MSDTTLNGACYCGDPECERCGALIERALETMRCPECGRLLAIDGTPLDSTHYGCDHCATDVEIGWWE